MLEIEVKLFLESESRAREVCRRLGLPWTEGTFERNRLFDFPDGRLARRGALVRIRERGRESFLTFKEKSDREVADAKVRLEYDTSVSDPASVIHLLVGVGLTEISGYDRFRARHLLGATHLEMDLMPGGWFCEIEGSPDEIRRVRQEAGLDGLPPVTWSYPEILVALQSAGMARGRWTFEAYEQGDVRLPAAGDPFWSRAQANH